MSNWNQNFTTLIRQSRPTFWGNWALNGNIQPGMVGYVDSATGNFTSTGDVIPQAAIDENPLSQKWDIKSSDVKVSQSNISLDGSATDPETGTKITAGLQVSWGFENAGSLSSSFAMTKESTLHDFPTLIQSQWDWLLKKATDLEMANTEGIVQGFCIITDVIYAKSGLNVGANSAKSNFSISGSVSGVNELAGDSLSGKGSYVSTSESASMDKHVWPAEAGVLATEEIPIAFAVASFEGKYLIPNWTHLLSSFVLTLDNSHGGTYIVDATLKYNVFNSTEIITESISGLTGGLTSSISDIPVTAQNLNFTVSYREVFGHDHTNFTWGSPVNQWVSGVRHVDVYGVWPGDPSAKDREA